MSAPVQSSPFIVVSYQQLLILKNCKIELLAKSLNHRYSSHSKEKEAKLSRPWTRAVFQYPQKSSSAQGWQVQGGCHSAGWQPTRGKEGNMKVASGPSLASLSLSIAHTCTK